VLCASGQLYSVHCERVWMEKGVSTIWHCLYTRNVHHLSGPESLLPRLSRLWPLGTRIGLQGDIALFLCSRICARGLVHGGGGQVKAALWVHGRS